MKKLNVRLTCSDSTGNVYIARYGKNPENILEKDEVKESELIDALVCHFLHDNPKGLELEFELRDKIYVMRLWLKGNK